MIRKIGKSGLGLIRLKKCYYFPLLLLFLCFFFLCCNSSKDLPELNTGEKAAQPQNPDKVFAGPAKPSAAAKDMVYIPAGEFLMGCADEDTNPDEKPIHSIYLNAYYIDKYEVTNSHYQQFIKETGHPAPFLDTDWAQPYNWHGVSYPDGRADYPVVLVNWEDAQAYARWAGKRLPTEAEWEKAARGGLVSQKYPAGNTLELDHASFDKGLLRENSLKPVGIHKPGGFGLYDMAGNVWEWCQDWYDETYYKKSPPKNPPGPAEGAYRVFRGGSWVNEKKFLRCAQRGKNTPDSKSHMVGFRCALTAEPQSK